MKMIILINIPVRFLLNRSMKCVKRTVTLKNIKLFFVIMLVNIFKRATRRHLLFNWIDNKKRQIDMFGLSFFCILCFKARN